MEIIVPYFTPCLTNMISTLLIIISINAEIH